MMMMSAESGDQARHNEQHGGLERQHGRIRNDHHFQKVVLEEVNRGAGATGLIRWFGLNHVTTGTLRRDSKILRSLRSAALAQLRHQSEQVAFGLGGRTHRIERVYLGHHAIHRLRVRLLQIATLRDQNHKQNQMRHEQQADHNLVHGQKEAASAADSQQAENAREQNRGAQDQQSQRDRVDRGDSHQALHILVVDDLVQVEVAPAHHARQGHNRRTDQQKHQVQRAQHELN